jgi:hypothetical protein|tara:strand:- start:216 stop:347 length:132 start_codon:yes stop_codon:yes gene_type:complete
MELLTWMLYLPWNLLKWAVILGGWSVVVYCIYIAVKDYPWWWK